VAAQIYHPSSKLAEVLSYPQADQPQTSKGPFQA